jgi:hypothetical protein
VAELLPAGYSNRVDDSFQTAVPPSSVYCHPDFLEKLAAYRTQPISKRASLLLQRLLIDPERLHFKSTQGQNKGCLVGAKWRIAGERL